jgi:DNA-binding LacI/PurR family transcriptional regulator
VLQAIKDLNYRPPLSTSQGAELSHSLGLLIQNQDSHPLTRHGYYVPLFEGFLSGSIAKKRSVTIMNESLWDSAQKGIRQYCDGRVDGILIAAPPLGCTFIEELKGRGFPFIVIGGCQDDPEIASVNCENKQGGRKAAAHLADLGHTSIAYIGLGEANYDSDLRQQGFTDELVSRGIPSPMIHVMDGLPNAESVARTIFASSELDQRPTAVFCFNDEVARKLVESLKELGFRVPEDVSVIGFDHTFEATKGPERLTTIRQEIYDMAVQGALLLADMTVAAAAGRRTPITKLVFQPDLVLGHTTGPAPTRHSILSNRTPQGAITKQSESQCK